VLEISVGMCGLCFWLNAGGGRERAIPEIKLNRGRGPRIDDVT
jgi:hypothetical protein